MTKVILAALILSLTAGNSFAEKSLCINNNPQAEHKIINLSQEEIGNLIAKDDPVLVFKKRTDALKGISAGDLVVAGSCKDIPQGFVRKVISVKESGSKVIIETIEGTLEDMLQCKVAPAPVKDGR